MNFPFDAVLFDMDGTICDSTAFHNAAWDLFARRHGGFGLAPDDPRLIPGRTVDVMRSVLGREISADEELFLHDDKERLFHEIARGKLAPLAGLAEYLGWLAERGVATALVTNAPRINIDFSLPELGLVDAFDQCLGAEDVLRGKPHPDPFLEACRRLGVAPERALVHEDSTLGIAAGVAAGCSVAAVLTGISGAAARAAGARWALSDYRDWMEQCRALP
ncbi:HAD family hydrolase [Niveibacterium terrae]|uniref:HAD family hydrolase n=1 Tax=Niveibacterium terrae TaxID=3373598 RepID=UPI003A8E09AA